MDWLKVSSMHRRAVAEIVAAIALLGVTIGLSSGLAATYYGWLRSFSSQSTLLEGQAAQLTSTRVYLVAADWSAGSKVWLFNAGGTPVTISEVYADGSLLAPGSWLLVDSGTGENSTSLLPGHLYALSVAASSSVVIYFGDLYMVEAAVGP